MSHNQPSAQAFAAIIIDSRGTTALHQAAQEGTLKDLCGVTAEFLATVKDNDGKTPLHVAAENGHLDQIPGVTAELLATVKDNDGETPLHVAARRGYLKQIGDLTIKLAEEMGILNATLQPKNIFVFTEDFRRNGTAYNKHPAIRRALLRAAHALPRLTATQRSVVKATLSAAQEGGFMLTPKALAKLL